MSYGDYNWRPFAAVRMWMGDADSLWRPRNCIHTPLARLAAVESFIVKNKVGRIYVEPCHEAWECVLDGLAEDNEEGRRVNIFAYDEDRGVWEQDRFIYVPSDYGQLLNPVIPRLRKMNLPRDVLVCAANIAWWETEEPNPYLREWTPSIMRKVNREMLEEALRAVGYRRKLMPCIGRKVKK